MQEGACTSQPGPPQAPGKAQTHTNSADRRARQPQEDGCQEHTARVALNSEAGPSFTEPTTSPSTVQQTSGGNDPRPAPTASQVPATRQRLSHADPDTPQGLPNTA